MPPSLVQEVFGLSTMLFALPLRRQKIPYAGSIPAVGIDSGKVRIPLLKVEQEEQPRELKDIALNK